MGEVTVAVNQGKINGQLQDMAKTANAAMTARYVFLSSHTEAKHAWLYPQNPGQQTMNKRGKEKCGMLKRSLFFGCLHNMGHLRKISIKDAVGAGILAPVHALFYPLLFLLSWATGSFFCLYYISFEIHFKYWDWAHFSSKTTWQKWHYHKC